MRIIIALAVIAACAVIVVFCVIAGARAERASKDRDR